MNTRMVSFLQANGEPMTWPGLPDDQLIVELAVEKLKPVLTISGLTRDDGVRALQFTRLYIDDVRAIYQLMKYKRG